MFPSHPRFCIAFSIFSEIALFPAARLVDLCCCCWVLIAPNNASPAQSIATRTGQHTTAMTSSVAPNWELAPPPPVPPAAIRCTWSIRFIPLVVRKTSASGITLSGNENVNFLSLRIDQKIRLPAMKNRNWRELPVHCNFEITIWFNENTLHRSLDTVHVTAVLYLSFSAEISRSEIVTF